MNQHQACAKLRSLLADPGLVTMPCCFDALSARLIQRSGFPLSFMSGFAVSASRLGMPDTGLISYAEMVDQGRNICAAVDIPIIGDADTGYGNVMNVRRTVAGYSAAGFAGVMIEDQLWPKRCGHTAGKQVVSLAEAENRVRAAVDARAAGADIVIMARTDARATHGISEAIDRCLRFRELGADITFLEAPLDVNEMRVYCDTVPGPKMANMIEQGHTPVLRAAELESIGYKIAAYPLALMSAAVHAMQETLATLSTGGQPPPQESFAELKRLVGFDAYDRAMSTYADE